MMASHEDCRPDDWVSEIEPITPEEYAAYADMMAEPGTPIANTDAPACVMLICDHWHTECGEYACNHLACLEAWQAEQASEIAAEEGYVRWLEDAGSRWDPAGYEHDRRMW